MESSSDRDEEEDVEYDTADEEEGEKKKEKVAVTEKATSTGRTSRNDSIHNRSPSPSSACHSLEWDSNGDDFFGPTPQK